MNRTIRLEKTPERIVSLVPSQTELLYDLGLGDRVTGITKFCIHPQSWFKTKTRVGGTKNVNHELIAALNPDLIIGNKEENAVADIHLLAQKYPVYMSDIYTTDDALRMIMDIGKLVSKEIEAESLTGFIKSDFKKFPQMHGTVLYLIWADPYMVAGPNTFIGDMILKTGLKNAITDPNARYLELTMEEIKKLNPEFIFLSSEPFPFKESHANEFKLKTASQIEFVDGEMFSWYGSRMKEMKTYFSNLAKRIG